MTLQDAQAARPLNESALTYLLLRLYSPQLLIQLFLRQLLSGHETLENKKRDHETKDENGDDIFHSYPPLRVVMPPARSTTRTPTQRLRMLGTQIPTKSPYS